MARPSKNAIEARKRRLLESQQRRLSRDLDRVSARLESCMACSVEKAEKEYARVEARAEAERRALEKRLGVSLADLRGSKKTAKKVAKKTAKKVSKKASKKASKKVSAKSVEAPATAKKASKKSAKKTSKKAAKKSSRASSEPSPAPAPRVAEAELEIRVGAAPVAEAPSVRLPPTRAPKSRVKPTAEGSSAPKARKGKLTYAQARTLILESIRSAGGWSTNPLLKVPHATAPGGRIRFYFKPRAIYADYAASAVKPQFSLNSARSLVSEGEVLALAGEANPAAQLLRLANLVTPGAQKDLF